MSCFLTCSKLVFQMHLLEFFDYLTYFFLWSNRFACSDHNRHNERKECHKIRKHFVERAPLPMWLVLSLASD